MLYEINEEGEIGSMRSVGSRDLSRIFFQGVHMESEVKLERKRAVNWGVSDTF